MNAGLLLTGLLGINKKVRDKDLEQWRNEVREVNKDEITQIQRQILFQNESNQDHEHAEYLELNLYNKQMENAKISWKTKIKTEFSPFEEFWFLQNKILKLKKVSEFLSLLLSVAIGLLFLSAPHITIKFYLGYAAIVLALTVILSYSASISKKSRRLRKLINPKSVEAY